MEGIWSVKRKETIIAILIMAVILLTSCSRAGHEAMQDQDTDPLPVKVLILPTTWFHDVSYDSAAVVRLDPDLTEKVFKEGRIVIDRILKDQF